MNNKKIELLQKLRQQLLDDLKEINELIYDRLACMSEDNSIQYLIRDPMLFPVSCPADEC